MELAHRVINSNSAFYNARDRMQQAQTRLQDLPRIRRLQMRFFSRQDPLFQDLKRATGDYKIARGELDEAVAKSANELRSRLDVVLPYLRLKFHTYKDYIDADVQILPLKKGDLFVRAELFFSAYAMSLLEDRVRDCKEGFIDSSRLRSLVEFLEVSMMAECVKDVGDANVAFTFHPSVVKILQDLKLKVLEAEEKFRARVIEAEAACWPGLDGSRR